MRILCADEIERACFLASGILPSLLNVDSVGDDLGMEVSSMAARSGAGAGSLKSRSLLLLGKTVPRLSRRDVLAKRAHQLSERRIGCEGGEYGVESDKGREKTSGGGAYDVRAVGLVGVFGTNGDIVGWGISSDRCGGLAGLEDGVRLISLSGLSVRSGKVIGEVIFNGGIKS